MVEPSDDLKALNPAHAVVWLENGKPKVYKRRWAVLASLCLTYFAWNAYTNRGAAVSTAYARHFGVQNNVNFDDGGYDLLAVSESGVLLFSYFFGAWLVEKYGLKTLISGSLAVCIGSWIWYLADDNLGVVVLGRLITATFGGSVPAAILAVSNRWFPETERGMATTLASLFSLLGSAAALLLAPFFYTNEFEVVDLMLKSCKVDDLDASTVSGAQNAFANGTFFECGDDAKDNFCCYQPIDIRSHDLLYAILPTLTFIFSVFAVRDLPPTAPSPAAEPRESVGLFRGLYMLFSKRDFAKVALSDFVVSGPVLVLYAALARLFPSSIDELAFAASAIGIGLAIPASLVVGRLLDKKKLYYPLTSGGYVLGTVFWILATICIASGTLAGAYGFFLFVVLSVMLFIAWQAAVYEYKIEISHNAKISLEGYIVGADRAVINLANLVFISTINPENLGSVLAFYLVGAGIMILGCIPVLLIKDKYGYLRTFYDRERKELDTNKLAA